MAGPRSEMIFAFWHAKVYIDILRSKVSMYLNFSEFPSLKVPYSCCEAIQVRKAEVER